MDCANNEYVNGFKVMILYYCGTCDDIGLNQIEFICENDKRFRLPGHGHLEGSLSEPYICPPKTYLTGLRLKHYESFLWDNYGATDLEGKCSDGTIIGGKAKNDGEWVGYKDCLDHTGIHGVKVLVDSSGYDKKGIVNVEMSCN